MGMPSRVFVLTARYQLARLHRHHIFHAAEEESRRASRDAALTLLGLLQEFRSRFECASKLWCARVHCLVTYCSERLTLLPRRWPDSYTIFSSSLLIISNIYYLATDDSLPLPAHLATTRDAVLRALTFLRGTPTAQTPLRAHTLEGIRILEILVAEERALQLAPRQPSDLERLKSALNVISRATLCTAPEETLELRALANLLSSARAMAEPSRAPTAAYDPSFALPFAGIQAPAVPSETPAPEFELYDDFFRSLGFLPPTVYPEDTGAPAATGLQPFVGADGFEDDAMAGWRGAFA